MEIVEEVIKHCEDGFLWVWGKERPCNGEIVPLILQLYYSLSVCHNIICVIFFYFCIVSIVWD